MDLRARSSTRRVGRQIVGSGEREGTDGSSQTEAGGGVGDVSTVGRIADETLSERGDEGDVFVARQTRSFSAKKLTRKLQKPTEQSMTSLKRLGRYVKDGM